MNEHDPPRLTDAASGTPDLLRDALVTARVQAPSAAQMASLAARLPVGAPPPAGPSGAAPAVAAPPSVLSGALIGAALGVIVAGAGFWAQGRGEAAREAAPRVAVTAFVEAPRVVTEAPAVSPVSTPVVASAAPSAARPAQLVASASAAVASSVPVAEPAPASGSGSEGAGAMGGPIDAETEAHFLQRAHNAVDASPARALALTEEHASRFPTGTLGQERELVAIQALVRLGRVDEARARGARFAAAFPGSAHRRRIEGLLGR